MPKTAKELSPLAVRRLNNPGVYTAGGVAGLLLRISDTGARYWILRATIGGKRCDMGIGPYPEVSLANAREQAAAMRDKVRAGIDPLAERKAAQAALNATRAKAMTFDQAAARYLASKTKEFRNPKHAAQWRSTLDTYVSPIIGSLPVGAVELAHIVRTLEPIWLEKTETAKRLRGRIERVLSWAITSGFRAGENPARWKGNLDAVLPQPGKVAKVAHHRALPWREIPAFMAKLRRMDGMGAKALEFAILTAARSGEVRGATWAEIDPDSRLWTIPASRMKAGKEHLVPLCDEALALLKSLPRFAGSEFVFPAVRGGQLSDMTISAVTRRMGVDAVPHGFRSTFRDWVSETTAYPHEVAEMALAHTITNAVERAYRRGDLLEKRRRLMDDWARFLREGHPAGELVPIRAERI